MIFTMYSMFYKLSKVPPIGVDELLVNGDSFTDTGNDEVDGFCGVAGGVRGGNGQSSYRFIPRMEGKSELSPMDGQQGLCPQVERRLSGLFGEHVNIGPVFAILTAFE